MVTSVIRRPLSWMLAICMLVLVFALAACGETTPAATTSGSTTSNTPAAAAGQVVTVKETKGASGDVYTCDPATISVKVGEKVQFTNMSDETQDFDQGQNKEAGVDFVMAINQSTTATFKTAGTFTIKSEKGASFTVTVA